MSSKLKRSRTLSIHDFGFAIPLVFIAVKLMDVGELISHQTADFLVDRLRVVWPSLGPQYEEFIRLGLVKDATYYVLFYLCLFILFVYFAQKVVRLTVANSDRLKNPTPKIVLSTLIVIPLIYVAMVLDTVEVRPLRPFEFFIDPFGFYYIRQWAVFSIVNLFVLLTAAATANVTKKSYARVRGTK